jgi:hypothetical protein
MNMTESLKNIAVGTLTILAILLPGFIFINFFRPDIPIIAALFCGPAICLVLMVLFMFLYFFGAYVRGQFE